MAKDDGDGTQPPAFGDALSAPVSDPKDDFKLTRVASPVKLDPSAVRDLVDAEMARDKLGETTVFAPADDKTPPPARRAEPIAPEPPLGMVPTARRRTRSNLLNYRPSLRMPRISMPPPGTVRKVRPSSGSTGIIAAVVLMIAFAVLAIEFLSSLVGSITSVFS
jgi:hypothetical protein